MNRIVFSISLVFSAVLGLYLIILFSGDVEEAQEIDELNISPTYRAVKLNSKLFDDNGVLSHQVVAEQMEHYQPLGFMVFDKPVYIVYFENSEPWQVTAEEGTLYDNSRIQLERNVKIQNMNPNDYVQEIATEYIEINLKDKSLISDLPVTISGESFTVQSVGIIGNLATQQYTLTEHVQSTFKTN